MSAHENRVFTFPVQVVDSPETNNGIIRTPTRQVAQSYCETQSRNLQFDVPDDPVDPKDRIKKAREVAITGDAAARVRFLERDVYIHTPDFIHVRDTVEILMSRARRFLNPGGMRILGSGGTGKDTIIRYFCEKYPSHKIGNLFFTPVLVVRLRERLTPSQLLDDLTVQLHGICRSSARLAEKEDILLEAMRNNEAKAVFINECQHLLSVKRPGGRAKARITGQAGDWLKFILDKVDLPLFFCGTPGWDDVLEEEDTQQLATRLTHRFQFSEFQPDAVFVGTLVALDEAIPMPEPAGFAEPPMAKALYQVCRGNWRRLMILLREALIVATEEGSSCIKREHLRRAYRTQFGVDGNPFE